MADSPPSKAAPPKFYKYRSLEGQASEWVERIVCQHEIYFAAAVTFNDPFDLRPPVSLDAPKAVQLAEHVRLAKKLGPPLSRQALRAEARSVVKAALNPRKQAETTEIFQALHTDYIKHQVGIFCVSTKRDDILMWSHYGDSHRGVCIEFDGTAKLMGQAHEVSYSKHRPVINFYGDNNREALNKTLLTKSDHWLYESEWRLFRAKEGPGVEEIRPNNVTGIIIGAEASESVRQKVLQWAAARLVPMTIYQDRKSVV